MSSARLPNYVARLLRGEPRELIALVAGRDASVLTSGAVIVIGCAVYGLGLGLWRAPEMALYVAIKLPLLVLATLFANALLNGLVATLLGTGLTLRSSLHSQMVAFSLAALILGSLAPVTIALALEAPSPDSDAAVTAHSVYLLTHTFLIGFAGVISQLHLWRLLRQICPTRSKARLTLGFWLSGNALFGTQLSWIMRPFFGSPNIEVQFLRDDPFRGTFIEAVSHATDRLIGMSLLEVLFITAAFSAIATVLYRQSFPQKNRTAPTP